MSECLGRLLQPYSERLHQIALLNPDANDVIEFKGGQWAARSPGEYWVDLLADPAVQAYAYTALPWTITNDKRLLGRDSALPPFSAMEISLGAGLDMTGGVLSVNTGTGGFVTALTGTANQVLVDGGVGPEDGPVTLTLPQDIHTGATPQFARIGVGVAASGDYGVQVLRATASPVTVERSISTILRDNSTASHTSYLQGIAVEVRNDGSNINSGYQQGLSLSCLNRNAANLAQIFGAIIEYGTYNGGADSTGTITEAIGIQISPLKTTSSTITTMYGLRIGDILGATRYSIYTGLGLVRFGDNVTTAGSLQTAAPSGGTAQPWKLGSIVTAASAPDATRYVEAEINGVACKLALIT